MPTRKDLYHLIGSEVLDSTRHLTPSTLRHIDDLIGRINSGLGSYFYLFYHRHSQELLYISERCEEFTGYPASVWQENGPALFTDLMATEAKQEIIHQSNICWQMLESTPGEDKIGSSITFDFNIQQKEQLRHFLNQHIVVTTGEDDNIKLCLAVFTDITHLKEVTDLNHIRSSVSIPGSKEHYVYNTVTQQLINLNDLTERESQVLAGYGSGKHTERIADELSISPYTVQTHRSKLLEKTGCKNLAELIHFAHVNSILQ
jgi:DNA-binding CsgD family transcriptional regulator